MGSDAVLTFVCFACNFRLLLQRAEKLAMSKHNNKSSKIKQNRQEQTNYGALATKKGNAIELDGESGESSFEPQPFKTAGGRGTAATGSRNA